MDAERLRWSVRRSSIVSCKGDNFRFTSTHDECLCGEFPPRDTPSLEAYEPNLFHLCVRSETLRSDTCSVSVCTPPDKPPSRAGSQTRGSFPKRILPRYEGYADPSSSLLPHTWFRTDLRNALPNLVKALATRMAPSPNPRASVLQTLPRIPETATYTTWSACVRNDH